VYDNVFEMAEAALAEGAVSSGGGSSGGVAGAVGGVVSGIIGAISGNAIAAKQAAAQIQSSKIGAQAQVDVANINSGANVNIANISNSGMNQRQLIANQAASAAMDKQFGFAAQQAEAQRQFEGSLINQRNALFNYAIFGFALVEALALFGLMISFLILFA